jgi:hypothetical protein
MAFQRGLAAPLAGLALFSTPALAERFYLGATGGASRIDSGYSSQVQDGFEAASPGLLIASDVRAETHGGAGRVFGGLRISEAFAFEVDYTRLATIRGFHTTRAANPDTARTFSPWQSEHEASAWGVSLLAHANVSNEVSLFGRAGVARTRLRQSVGSCLYRFDNPEGPPVNCFEGSRPDVEETRPVAGLGVDWRVAKQLAVRVSWDRYFGVGEPFSGDPRPTNRALGEFDIDYFGVGLTYAF